MLYDRFLVRWKGRRQVQEQIEATRRRMRCPRDRHRRHPLSNEGATEGGLEAGLNLLI